VYFCSRIENNIEGTSNNESTISTTGTCVL
jgi:hypothetical protein